MQKLTILVFGLFLLFVVGCSKDSEDNLSTTSDAYYDSTGEAFIGDEDISGENYAEIIENEFVNVADEAQSTFSIDADGAAYSNVRRFLEDGQLPPPDAVRLEEMINFFDYDYTGPNDDRPIAITTEVSDCPWTAGHKLISIGIQGKTILEQDLPPANLVFLIDASGSMSTPDKLALLKEGFGYLVEILRPEDRVAIVAYAGAAGLVLPSTSGDQKETILTALDNLKAGGSTAGGEGIELAYKVAVENYVEGGNNRVILASDGDFNVGISTVEALTAFIEEKRETGVFLTTLGFGSGNLNDAVMEQLANNGNGTYEYIDDIQQARKVFVEEFGKLFTIAKDVKVQITFDPAIVRQYRLIGYENRVLDNEDFEDDEKDAGELGSGQNVTAFYEIILEPRPSYAGTVPLSIDFRYKQPDSDVSELLEVDAVDGEKSWNEASHNYRFAASVAAFGMVLRDSQHKGTATYDDVINWSSNALSFDPKGYKTEFVGLVNIAKGL